MPQLKLVRTLWGVISGEDVRPESWEPLLKKLKSLGFSAFEACIGPFFPFVGHEKHIKDLLTKYEMEFIGQVHTCGYPVSSRKVSDHVDSLRTLVRAAKEMGCVFVNAHSGHDSWTLEQCVEFYLAAVQIEREEGITIAHETHRRRALYNPWRTYDILKQVPELKLTADLSHWVCVCERLFDEKYDDDWPAILQAVARSCHLIHARVGYDEGPQVPDPSASEYNAEVQAHLKWWNVIWEQQNKRGEKYCYVEPEHGPPRYLHTLPHTNVPVADLWEVNNYVARRVQEAFPFKQ